MSAIRLFKFSLFIRLFVILLQVIFNRCVPDHNADAFRLPYEKGVGAANSVISYLFEGFGRWDAQYFLHISLYGYTHENTLAFFPLFPVLLRNSCTILSIIFPFGLSPLNCALLSGVLLNLFLTSLTTVALYKLTQNVFHSEIFAFTSALLFCFNPASIFFSALYSESLFSLLTFCGLWALEKNLFFISLSGLALSASVRSNGILSAGFLIYSAPIIIIILVSCIKYFIKHRRELWFLGLFENKMYDTSDVFSNIKCFPYFLHIFFATIFCILFIHIQVVTRMLCSSSPILYWVATTAILPGNEPLKSKMLKSFKLEVLNYLSHHPDFASTHFCLFLYMKKHLAVQKFHDDDINTEVETWHLVSFYGCGVQKL
ncbi:GPI mannosyltransferase 2 [Trichonephila inaurata madagascariensis]|uniref:GPI mannosyltransferase 2 n=1 Tax=Trichonephila inaurata madagascariensis TaxID=2747483 RepID=A0A8X7CS55_9ARAC|nr:GPI mannosyltransferase 2 [Trichonephila inaurata madagascariensis]